MRIWVFWNAVKTIQQLSAALFISALGDPAFEKSPPTSTTCCQACCRIRSTTMAWCSVDCLAPSLLLQRTQHHYFEVADIAAKFSMAASYWRGWHCRRPCIIWFASFSNSWERLLTEYRLLLSFWYPRQMWLTKSICPLLRLPVHSAGCNCLPVVCGSPEYQLLW